MINHFKKNMVDMIWWSSFGYKLIVDNLQTGASK